MTTPLGHRSEDTTIKQGQQWVPAKKQRSGKASGEAKKTSETAGATLKISGEKPSQVQATAPHPRPAAEVTQASPSVNIKTLKENLREAKNNFKQAIQNRDAALLVECLLRGVVPKESDIKLAKKVEEREGIITNLLKCRSLKETDRKEAEAAFFNAIRWGSDSISSYLSLGMKPGSISDIGERMIEIIKDTRSDDIALQGQLERFRDAGLTLSQIPEFTAARYEAIQRGDATLIQRFKLVEEVFR